MLSPTYQPSKLSRKMPYSPLTSPVNPSFRKEGDQDPWNDYKPTEDPFLQNNENIEPTNVSSFSQKTKSSTAIGIGTKPFAKKNTEKVLSDCSNPIVVLQQEERDDFFEKKPITFEKAYKEYAHKLLEQQFSEVSKNSSVQEQNQAVLEGLLLGPTQIKELELQGEQAERSKMINFGRKLEAQALKSQQKMNYLQQEVLTHQFKECTFTPNVRQMDSQRDFNGFLQGQRTFQERLEAKKQVLKENQEKKLQEQAPLKPEINKTSRRLLEKSTGNQQQGSVFDRLYNTRFAREELKIEEVSLGLLPEVPEINESSSIQQQPFTPSIHYKSKQLIRNEPIEEILYKDAKRRQDSFKKKSTNNSNNTCNKESKVLKNPVSQKLIIQKFIKEFENSVLKVMPPAENQEISLDYMTMGEVLKVLGFISLKESQDPSNLGCLPHERMLLADMWTILRGEELGGVSKRNLCMFLLSIQGLYWSELSENKALSTTNDNNLNFGVFNEKNEWEIDESGAKWIHKTYELFYRTRLASETLKKLKTEEETSRFQPEISETSKVLAEHYRERLLEEFAQILNTQNLPELKVPENGALTHTDLLVLQKKTQLLQHERKGKEKKLEEVKQCPFKPLINKKKSKTLTHKGVPRHLELYEMSKTRFSRVDRDPHEIEYERNSEQCTFKPDINQNNSNGSVRSTKQKEFFAKDIDKTIERMRNARKERELVRMWTERGIPLKSEGFANISNGKNCPMSSSRITRLEDEPMREEIAENEENMQLEHEENEGNLQNENEEIGKFYVIFSIFLIYLFYCEYIYLQLFRK